MDTLPLRLLCACICMQLEALGGGGGGEISNIGQDQIGILS